MSLANRRSGLGLKTDTAEYFTRGTRKVYSGYGQLGKSD